MIKSMTGYGKHEILLESGKITAEIRSVNHRYGEVFVKLPRPLLALENDVRKSVAERLKRGKIEVYIQVEGLAGTAGVPTLNVPLAKAYYEAFTKLKESLGLYDPVPLSLIASQKDLLTTEEFPNGVGSMGESVIEAVGGAVDNLDAMRVREGKSLRDDLQLRRTCLHDILKRIEERSPVAVAENGARFRARIRQLAGDCGIEETRIVQEIALMADRLDINEELVRFKSHLKQFDDGLEMDEPVGRKLDFIIQELNREVNTIGSKANDAEITSMIVDLKAELEKIREQVQNIE
jgi:uncharacterized protein (TIGR00255 family)